MFDSKRKDFAPLGSEKGSTINGKKFVPLSPWFWKGHTLNGKKMLPLILRRDLLLIRIFGFEKGKVVYSKRKIIVPLSSEKSLLLKKKNAPLGTETGSTRLLSRLICRP